MRPLLLCLLLSYPMAASAEELAARAGGGDSRLDSLSGREIAERSENRAGYRESESTALEMTLINRQGKRRTRELLRYQLKGEDGKRTLMKFLYPNDIKDTGTLNIEVDGSDDIQYLYLPALKKLRRIASTNKSQSWVGSDFTFEDLQEIELDDFRFEALGTEVVDNRLCWRYSMEPLPEAGSTYGRQIRWVTVDGFLPIKAQYFDKQGAHKKTIRFLDLRPTNGIEYAWKIVVEDVQEQHTTELLRRWLHLDTGLDAAAVSTRQLKRPISLFDHPPGLHEFWRESIGER